MPTALLSVYDKTGIVGFAQQLYYWGWDIIASGGTAQTVSAATIPVRDVGELVGGGFLLGHRVVTLSREVHAGLLAKDTTHDRDELERLGVPFIDLLYVNLYPLRQEIRKKTATLESITEMTDIGGPALLRSAAKGRRLILCGPDDVQPVYSHLTRNNGQPGPDETLRREMAFRAELTAASYALLSAIALCPGEEDKLSLQTAYFDLTRERID